jgi:hypothetical protein
MSLSETPTIVLNTSAKCLRHKCHCGVTCPGYIYNYYMCGIPFNSAYATEGNLCRHHMWFWRESLRAKSLPHMSQRWGLICVWTAAMWRDNDCFCVNPWPQSSQLNGRGATSRLWMYILLSGTSPPSNDVTPPGIPGELIIGMMTVLTSLDWEE